MNKVKNQNQFSKFIKDILNREKKQHEKLEEHTKDNPNRVRNKLYREHPHNRIKWNQEK